MAKKLKLKRHFWIHFVMMHINLGLYFIVPDITKDWFFMFILFEGIMAMTTLVLSYKLGEWNDKSIEDGRIGNNDRSKTKKNDSN